MNSLDSLFYKIQQQVNALQPQQREDLRFILEAVFKASEREMSDNNKNNPTLGQLRKHIERKLSSEQIQNSSMEINEIFLRNLRNDLVHGRNLNRYDSDDLRDIQSQFWHALSKSSGRWQFDDLKSFLSYCIPHRGESTAKTHSGIVKYYETVFFSLPESIRPPVFKELIMRLFSEPQFRENFETKGKSR